MSEKRKEEWIKILTPENKDMIASPSYVKKLLKIDFSNLLNRIHFLENKVDKLESPQRQKKIIELLRKYGKHNKIWLGNRIDYRWYDLDYLIKKGVVFETKSGTQSMLELSEFKENGEK